jgi:hypothetical protein
MNDDAFARLVAEDVKNKSTPQQQAYLTLPENWIRWQKALNLLSENLVKQIAGIHEFEREKLKEYELLGDEGIRLIAETSASFDERRAKIERFNFYVQEKYDEVSRMIAVGSSNVDERIKMVEFFRRAIEKHKALIDEYEMDPTAIDYALWDTLDGKWNFDTITEENAFGSFSD